MQRIFSTAFVFLLLLTTRGTFANHGSTAFSDLSSTDPYYATILELHARAIVTGNSDKTITAENPLNRAELVTIVNRAARIEKLSSDKNCFKDVREEWFAADICAAARLKFIKGYDDGFFRPAREVTSGESAKILLNTLIKSEYQDLNEALTDLETKGLYRQKYDLNASIKRNETFERLLRIVHHTEQNPLLLDQMDQHGNLFDPDIDPIKNQIGADLPTYVEYKQNTYDYFLGKTPVILFFHAPWCPLCRESNAVLEESLTDLKGGVIWMKVDYDTQNELKKKYGITYQDTFVLINAQGEVVIKKNALRSAKTAQEWIQLALQNE